MLPPYTLSSFGVFFEPFSLHFSQGEHFQHRSHILMCMDDTPNQMWSISEARKMELTRSISALARPAGDTYLGSTSYADAYKTDTILQVSKS